MTSPVITGAALKVGHAQSLDYFWRCLIQKDSQLSVAHPPEPVLRPMRPEISRDDYPDLGHKARYLDSQTMLATTTALDCADMLGIRHGISEAGLDPNRVGIVLGTQFAQLEFGRRQVEVVSQGMLRRLSPHTGLAFYFGASVGEVSWRLQSKGENCAVTTGSSIGADALHIASQTLTRHRNDLVLVGAAEAVPTDFLEVSMAGVRPLARRYFEPFEESCEGAAPADGAVVIGLEDADSAYQRSRTPAAILEAVSSANASDSMLVAGADLATAYERVLTDLLGQAGCSIDDIDLILPTGDGYPDGTAIEMSTLARMFCGRPGLIYSPKPLFGYGLSFNILLDVVTGILCMQNSRVPGLASAPCTQHAELFVPPHVVQRDVRRVLLLHRSWLGGRVSGVLLAHGGGSLS